MKPMMIQVSGSERLTSTKEIPVWVKTRLYRKGHLLCADTYLVAAGRPKFMHNEVDMRVVARAVAAYQAKKGATVGLSFKVNPIKRKKGKRTGGIVASLAKNKLIHTVSRHVDKASKVAAKVALSKEFRVVLGATSAVLATTAVGAPAAAALAGATVALSATAAYRDNAAEINKELRKVKAVRVLQDKIAKLPKQAVDKFLSDNGATVARVKTDAKKAHAEVKKLAAQMPQLKAESDKAKEYFKNIAMASQFATDPVIKDKARKLARIVRIAAETRAKVKGIAERNAGGLPGLFIDGRGRVKRGHFERTLVKAEEALPGILYDIDETKRGRFIRTLTPDQVEKLDTLKKLAKAQKIDASELRQTIAEVKEERQEEVKTKKATAELVTQAKAAKRANTQDVQKAITAVKKSKGMASTDRKRLVSELRSRIMAKKDARTNALLQKKQEVMSQQQALAVKKAQRKAATKARRAQKKQADAYAAHMRKAKVAGIVGKYDCIRLQ